jgi:uncharacterized protein with von Willebrand factor type A (vWA) domain
VTPGRVTVVLEPAALAGGLARALERAGLRVGPDRTARYARALRLVPPSDPRRLHSVAQATLCSSPAEVALLDRVLTDVLVGLAGFPDVAGHRGDPTAPPVPAPAPQDRAPPERSAGSVDPEAVGVAPDADLSEVSINGRRELALPAASSAERLSTTSFAELSDDETAALAALVRTLPLTPPLRRRRRTVTRPRGRSVDLRATLAAARATGGDPADLKFRRPRQRARRVVVLLDVSASMQPYTRAYMQFLYAAVNGIAAEAFVMATRITRLTRALRDPEPDRALARAGAAAPDWSSGTLLADGLGGFLDAWGRRGMARGAVVVVISDGWERRDPSLLGEQMARLHRLAHRVVWVNPRKSAPGYRPLVGGMAAALPHCDVFLSGHSLTALTDLADAITGRRSDHAIAAGRQL